MTAGQTKLTESDRWQEVPRRVEFEDDATSPVTMPPEFRGQAGQRDRAYLVVLSGPNVGEMFKLNQDSVVIGRGRGADVQVLEEGISRRHASLHMSKNRVLLRDLGSRNGTFVNGKPIQKQELFDGDKIHIGSTAILKFTYHDDLEESFQRQMYESALRDGLTHIFNRRYFYDRLEAEFHFAQRHLTPLSLILFDIDHFKQVNDRYGHLAGDQVLIDIVKRVQVTMRSEDVLARYGGEEFALVCRSIEHADAAKFAERVRRAVADVPFAYKDQEFSITVSLGVTTYPDVPAGGVHGLVDAADQALYRAKRAGRNRAEIAAPGLPRE